MQVSQNRGGDQISASVHEATYMCHWPMQRPFISMVHLLGHWIASVSREPLLFQQFCRGAYWICKFMRLKQHHAGRWAQSYVQFTPCLEVNMLCTVVRQGQRNALHVRLIKSCHTTTVHTECFRGYVITCVNVVQVGCGIMWICIWWMVPTVTTLNKDGWIMFLVTWTKRKCARICVVYMC